MQKTKIFNAKVITPFRIINNGCVIIDGEKIAGVHEGNIEASDCNEIDAGGNYVSPGFIDIHTHGGGGFDYVGTGVEDFLGAARSHAKHGATSLLPTISTCSFEELKKAVEVFGQAKKMKSKGANLLGLHLEGPYFAMAEKGAQDPRDIRLPKPEEYEEILSWSDDIVIWGSAPEIDGALEFGRRISQKGIVTSIAHTESTYDDVVKAIENGYTHMTHLYSSMPGVKRINLFRHAGAVESAYIFDELTVEVIADGCHLPGSLLKMIYQIKGTSKIALITDSMKAAGMPEGTTSNLGKLPVVIEDGVAKLADKTAFAGSVATPDRLVRTMINMADVPLVDAVRMATYTPATIIGKKNCKGTLTAGKDADITIFDAGINIQKTFVKGEMVYEKK
jgi:N-acetylglucosamine-6-phosphate deacetylase